MRKADIYFNGVIVNTVEFDRMNPDFEKDCVILTVKISDCESKIVALVPNNHLIIVKD
jgi:hypothetical protein